MNKKLYVLIVVAMLAAMILPMTAFAKAGDDPLYVYGQVWDTTNQMGIGGAVVVLYYERTTIVSADRWDPDRYLRTWEYVGSSTTDERGHWMVSTSFAHDGRYKLVVTAPEDALLPDGQAVTYTTDGTVNIPVMRDGFLDPANVVLLPEDAELGPNQAQYLWGIDGLNWEPWQFTWWQNLSDWRFNFVADTTLTPGPECGVVDMLYVYGMVYDPARGLVVKPWSSPVWPDVKEDGIPGVRVELYRGWFTKDPALVGWQLRQEDEIRFKPTNGDGYYFFAVEPTKSMGVGEKYEYRVEINGVSTDWFNAATCPVMESKRVEANFNMPLNIFDSLHTLP